MTSASGVTGGGVSELASADVDSAFDGVAGGSVVAVNMGAGGAGLGLGTCAVRRGAGAAAFSLSAALFSDVLLSTSSTTTADFCGEEGMQGMRAWISLEKKDCFWRPPFAVAADPGAGAFDFSVVVTASDVDDGCAVCLDDLGWSE
jgi:hypothetical protein